jgi:hypothetical protein
MSFRAAVAILALVPPLHGLPAAAANVFDSRYSRFDYAHCREGRSPEPGVIEVHVCDGPGHIAVTWSGEPDNSDIAFGRDPLDESLGLGDFHEARDTVEWRTQRRHGVVAPIAAIVRYDVGPNVSTLNRTRLVVYRLEPGGRSCVMGAVDGARPNANAEARQLADRFAGSFVCGKSRRR